MLKYSDWINFMTYDLHGIWDAGNPIGSIVQGHTNLTEIKLATELLWRVGVPPSKVFLGFGFYGRSFTLADPSCSKPGCPFTGASNPGKSTQLVPCTAKFPPKSEGTRDALRKCCSDQAESLLLLSLVYTQV
jgi:GH18 family chitinase